MNARLIWKLVQAFVFIIAGLVFYHLCNFNFLAIGSTLTGAILVRYLPYDIFLSLPIFAFFAIHNLLHPVDDGQRKKMFLIDGCVMSGLSLVGLIIWIVYMANGTYSSIRMGGPSYLFPLDCLLGFLFFLLLGGASIFASFKIKEMHPSIEKREPIKGFWNVVLTVLASIYVVFTLAFAGDLALIFHAFDYSFSNFAYVLPVYLLMAHMVGMLAYYEYGYRSLSPEKKEKTKRKASLICLCVSVALTIYLFICIAVHPSFVVESMTAVFIFDFLISKTIGPLLMLGSTLVAPLLAFILSFFPKKKEEPKAEEPKAEEEKA